MAIDKFRGDHYFLSNMYRLEVPISSEVGLLVPTSEHAYQAAKFTDPEVQYQIASTTKGIESKDLAHELQDAGAIVKSNWPEIKLDVMLQIVREKFLNNPDIAQKLVETGQEELIEGNTWGDRFWGVDPIGSRDGMNHLGMILMQVRGDL